MCYVVISCLFVDFEPFLILVSFSVTSLQNMHVFVICFV